MPNVAAQLAENLAEIRTRIAAAAREAGRSPDEITLVAVTKYVDAATTQALVEAGCADLGESRPQSLWEKAEQLTGDRVRWHMIGHLQRNKVPRTLPHVALIHSVDSVRLLAAIDQAAREQNRPTPVLLEVNISGDAEKHGFAPGELEPLLPELANYAFAPVRGLMAMAAREGGLDVARRNFADLRNLRDALAAVAPPEGSLAELSMGMSGDFEEAVREGATLVRVGSLLFRGLEP